MVKKASVVELADELAEVRSVGQARKVVAEFLTDKRVKVTDEMRKAIQYHIEQGKSISQIHFLIGKKLSVPTIRKIVKERANGK